MSVGWNVRQASKHGAGQQCVEYSNRRQVGWDAGLGPPLVLATVRKLGRRHKPPEVHSAGKRPAVEDSGAWDEAFRDTAAPE